MTLPECTRLENSAIIYPSCRTRKYASMFRVSVTLDEDVDRDILGAALETTVERFPSFRYSVRNGLFWWFLQKLENKPSVAPPSPLRPFSLNSNGGYMFRLSSDGRRLDLDVFHALTDGTGAMTFLLSLTAEYLRLRYGTVIEYGKWVVNPFEEPSPEEVEDGFDYFSGVKGSLDNEHRAYHVEGREEKPGLINTLGLSMSVDDLRNVARERGCTVTELSTAVLLQSLQQLRSASPSRRKSPYLRIEVPVNLRPVFGRSTLRNFSSYVYIGTDVRNGDLPFDAILEEVKCQKRLFTRPGRLVTRVAANVSLEDNLAIRCIPRFIKKPVINLINRLKGDNYSSYTFSNLGNIELPAAMQEHVKDIHFVLGRPMRRSGACACVSYGGKVNFDFSRKIREDGLERAVVENFRALGIWARVSVPSDACRPSCGWTPGKPVFRSGLAALKSYLLF